MPWIQLTLECPVDALSQYEDALLEAGANAVTITDNADQPLFEPPPGETPLWDQNRVTGLFEASADADLILHIIRQKVSEHLPPYRFEQLEDKDWEREWMKNFHPIQCGQRLWICPSWREAPDPNAVNLMLDPGLAFGTGTHPTTALCLAWLDAQPLHDKTLIDFGCGSGILAIAGRLLGAGPLWCIDNDPQALTATRNNADQNQVVDNIHIIAPEAVPQLQADVLVANILAAPLVSLSEHIASLVKPNGLLALSGILKSQANDVINAYTPWFELDPISTREDWVRISGRKRA